MTTEGCVVLRHKLSEALAKINPEWGKEWAGSSIG